MSLRLRVLKCALLGGALLVPAVAYAADTDGAAGTVQSVSVNESGSDEASTVRGELVVAESTGTQRKYSWGGTVCSGRNVSEASVALLIEGLRGRDAVQIAPSYKPGVGGARCLVGFRLEPVPAPVAR